MERAQVVVVGAGVAGAWAAIEAARAGLEVRLVDEHPLAFSLMASDIPLYFGQRALPTVASRGTALARVVATNPLLQEAEEVGVRLHLGTTVWSSDPDGTLALADDTRSWLLRYDHAIFAPGARDLGLAFRGWERAGVLGAGGALALLERYQAFGGRRVAVLGSGDLGLLVATRALERGVEGAGGVEVAPQVRGRAALREPLERAGVPFYPGHTVKEARGGAEVEALALVRVDGAGRPVPGGEVELACDTVCLAVGLVPSVELLSWTGCALAFRAGRGGFVPVLDDELRSTAPSIFVAGDAAGSTEEGFARPEVAAAQGRLAALAVARSLGVSRAEPPPELRQQAHAAPAGDPAARLAYLRAWLASMREAAGGDVTVCLCEEVTARDLEAATGRGLLHPDHIKRVTRAGMGPCQGRRCREQVQLLVAEARGVPVEEVPLASYRPPFRPLPLRVVQHQEETPEEREAFLGYWYRRRREEYLRATGRG